MAQIVGDLDELTSLIRRSARQEALDVEAAARRRAQQVQEEAHATAAALRAEALAAASLEAAEERRRALARAALDAQHRRLAARAALLEQVWVEAERELRLLPGQSAYDDTLRRLALGAAQTLGQDTIILASDAVGHELLTAERLAAWSVAAQVQFVRSDQPAPIWGGLLAWDAGRRRQVDASFATRLELARAGLRERVAEVLGIR
jgi:vacuolar-type H+-ATPase subunit E/Vma4